MYIQYYKDSRRSWSILFLWRVKRFRHVIYLYIILQFDGVTNLTGIIIEGLQNKTLVPMKHFHFEKN